MAFRLVVFSLFQQDLKYRRARATSHSPDRYKTL